MSDVIYFAKNIGGCSLRTTKSSNCVRYYGSITIQNRTQYVRISKHVYDYINDVLAKRKDSFITVIKGGKTTHEHYVSL